MAIDDAKQFVKSNDVATVAEAVAGGKLSYTQLAEVASKKMFVAVWLKAHEGNEYTEAEAISYMLKHLGEKSRATVKAYMSWAKRPDEPSKCPFRTRCVRDDDGYRLVPREHGTM